jgi:hypothetical protein
MDFDPHSAIEYIYKNAPAYGAAKGKVAELETYKSSLKAILMKQSNETAIGAQEREAYAHADYQNLCVAIGQAVEHAETLKWRLEAAKMRFEAYRTEQASNRHLERMTT